MNQLHVLPEDWSAANDLITPLLERIDPNAAETQFLVVTADADAAAGLGARLASVARREVRAVAATDARRATRVLGSAPAHLVVGPPEVLVDVVRAAALKLASVQVVVLAWVDDLDGAGTRALESLMAEVPKESLRLVVTANVTPSVEQLVERYARRARRLQSVATDATPPVSLSYIMSAESGRLATLRRILDAADPESALIIARSPETRASIELLLRSLGYSGDTAAFRVAETPDGSARMVVVFELPTSDEELRRLVRAAGSARVIVLIAPRQIESLRRLAGGAITPFALPAAAERARTHAERMRDELRAVLAAGQYSRELLSLEPLLDDYDGVELAAAALRLLETERAKPRAPATNETPAMTRLYVNVGEMDSVRPGDLVGAITNEAGISRSDLGRVEVRERHSTVEVATGVANTVVDRMTGVSIKGRRALVKVDEGGGRERPARPPMRSKPDRPRRPR